MLAAREWAAAHRPVATFEHMPFPDHRTCAQVREQMERLDASAGRMADMFAGKVARA